MTPAFGTAAAADIPALVELLGILFTQEAELEPDPEKQRRALQIILADGSRARIYVARDGERIVAMAALHFTTSTAEGGKVAWFEDCFVRPEHRALFAVTADPAHAVELCEAGAPAHASGSKFA